MRRKKTYVGTWRITEMEQWDNDFIDLVEPGHLTIKNWKKSRQAILGLHRLP
jgi:hypothetical protein